MILKTVLSSIGAISVGGGVVSLALWQAGNIGGGSAGSAETTLLSSSEGFSLVGEATTQKSLSSSLPEARKNVNQGNCVVVEDIEDVFSHLTINKDEYITVTCERTNSADSERSLADNWTGLFPTELFANVGTLSLGTTFDIETKTDEDDDSDYTTKFTSGKFSYYSLDGKWKEGTKKILDKLLVEVKAEEELGDSQSIYLLFPPKE